MLIPNDQIRVAMVDDHDAVRLGFRACCHINGFNLAAVAATVDELFEALRSALPGDAPLTDACDVVVLDLSLADSSSPGLNVAKLVEAGLKVLIFSIADRPAPVAEALRAGAVAVIKKSQSMDDLVEAIQLVASGIEVNNTETSAAIDSDSEFKATAGLSPREREVLQLYASGFALKQVASALKIKESTVREHIDRVRRKYSAVGRPAPDKADLVVRAIEEGLIVANQL